jgi:hypothetical protein
LVAGSSTTDLPAAAGKRLEEQLAEPKTKLSLVEALRFGASQVADMKMCPAVQGVLAKISLCRTHVLGGRKFQCHDCGEMSSLYNSCGDRHCPGCSGGKRVDFNEKASKLLMSGVSPRVVYYQVVFTLPSELSELALANQNEMADLLLQSAWKCLSKNIRDEQGYDPAAISVLHTWNQQLEAHWHAHLLVPGEGPALEGRASASADWKQATAPPQHGNSDGHYLVNADSLKSAFRKRAIARLRWLRNNGKLKFGGKFESLRSDENWEAFIEKLQSKTWVAYIQPPPTETSCASEVVNYLTRYLTGGPISDHRIVSADQQSVTFMAREGKRVGGERKQVPITLSICEFMKRWCLHILPEQLTRTRYFGGWSNNRSVKYMARCEEILRQLGRIEADDEADELANDNGLSLPETSEDEAGLSCPHCGSTALELLSDTPKPSWREVFWRESETCPGWYAELQQEDHHRFWTAEYGEGFYDWYRQTLVESAKEIAAPRPPQIQGYLPGLTPTMGYEIYSF